MVRGTPDAQFMSFPIVDSLDVINSKSDNSAQNIGNQFSFTSADNFKMALRVNKDVSYKYGDSLLWITIAQNLVTPLPSNLSIVNLLTTYMTYEYIPDLNWYQFSIVNTFCNTTTWQTAINGTGLIPVMTVLPGTSMVGGFFITQPTDTSYGSQLTTPVTNNQVMTLNFQFTKIGDGSQSNYPAEMKFILYGTALNTNRWSQINIVSQ